MENNIYNQLALLLTNYGHYTDLSQKQQKPDNVVRDNSPGDVPQQKVDHFTCCHTKIMPIYGNLRVKYYSNYVFGNLKYKYIKFSINT